MGKLIYEELAEEMMRLRTIVERINDIEGIAKASYHNMNPYMNWDHAGSHKKMWLDQARAVRDYLLGEK